MGDTLTKALFILLVLSNIANAEEAPDWSAETLLGD